MLIVLDQLLAKLVFTLATLLASLPNAHLDLKTLCQSAATMFVAGAADLATSNLALLARPRLVSPPSAMLRPMLHPDALPTSADGIATPASQVSLQSQLC